VYFYEGGKGDGEGAGGAGKAEWSVAERSFPGGAPRAATPVFR